MNGGMTGFILCGDERLCRLLEIELSHLGVMPHTAGAIDDIPAEAGVDILLLDGDDCSAADMAMAEVYGCPLLVFGREPAVLSIPPECGLYLRRPFALTELERSVRRLLAGSSGMGSPVGLEAAPAAPMTVPLPLSASSTVPSITAANGVVTVGSHRVTLTPTEWVIFEYLNARRGETVSRDELSALLGGGGNSVDVYVCHLRTKIEKPLGRRMILTVRGVGYRMTEP